MQTLFEKTKRKEDFIRSKNYNFIEIWEHEWDDMVKNDSLLQEFIKNSKIRPPLKPRDALFGGRTNAATLYYQCIEHEKINYFDFTYLYPYVQKNQKMVPPQGNQRIRNSSRLYQEVLFKNKLNRKNHWVNRIYLIL